MNQGARRQDSKEVVYERIAVVSDLHLAGKGQGHACQHTEAQLLAWFSHLRATHDVVVLNGDIYDLDRGPTPWSHRAVLARSRTEYPELHIELSAPSYLWNRGNHDHVLEGEGVPEVRCLRVGSWLVQVEHGHRFNPWIKRHAGFTSLVTWASGRVMEGPLAPIYRLMRRLESWLGDEENAQAGEPPALESRALAWTATVDTPPNVLVIGHTHVAGIYEADGVILANPGDSIAGELRWISVCAQREEVAMMGWSEGRERLICSSVLASGAIS